MRHIILDTNIILQIPEILSQNIENVKLIIPDTVLNEIRNITVHGNYSQDLRKLIYDAANTDFVEVFDARSLIGTKFDSKFYFEKLSSNDVILIKFYESYIKDINPDSVLATDDKPLIVFLKQLKLNVITSNELRKLFLSAKTCRSSTRFSISASCAFSVHQQSRTAIKRIPYFSVFQPNQDTQENLVVYILRFYIDFQIRNQHTGNPSDTSSHLQFFLFSFLFL